MHDGSGVAALDPALASGPEGVLVAMSGGVDSAVAAGLLSRAGVETVGATLKVFCYSGRAAGERGCCSLDDIRQARRCALRIGVRHLVLDLEDSFRQTVIRDFVEEYAAGRTPNPCVRCNTFVKFGTLLRWLDELGLSRIATGHYARKLALAPPEDDQSWLLARGADRFKDQSYVLWGLDRRRLDLFLFPVGTRHKAEVRRLARQMDLPVAEKPESQDICFVGDRHYTEFLREESGERDELFRRGPIRLADGRLVGLHRGLAHYTVGQRRGLGVASPSGRALYVIRLEAAANTLWVGEREELGAWGLRADGFNRLAPWRFFDGGGLQIQLRAHQDPIPVRAALFDGERGFEVRFAGCASGVSPGQSAVLYRDEIVLGGGRIVEVTGAGKRTCARSLRRRSSRAGAALVAGGRP